MANVAGRNEGFIASVRETLRQLANNPHRFGQLEIVAQGNYRRVKLRDFPYIVVFAIEEDVVVVNAVGHTSRGPLFWQQRLS